MPYVRKRVSMTSFVTHGDPLGWAEARGSGPGHSNRHPYPTQILDPPLRRTAWSNFGGSPRSMIWSSGAGIFACGRRMGTLSAMGEKKWGVVSQIGEHRASEKGRDRLYTGIFPELFKLKKSKTRLCAFTCLGKLQATIRMPQKI